LPTEINFALFSEKLTIQRNIHSMKNVESVIVKRTVHVHKKTPQDLKV